MRSIVNWMMFKVGWNQTFFIILSGVPKKRPGTFFLVYHILETWKEICQTLRRLKLPTSSEILFAWQLPLVYTSTISRWVLLTIELACCYWMVGQRHLPCNDVLVLVIQSHTHLLSECKPRQQLQTSQKLLPGRKTFFQRHWNLISWRGSHKTANSTDQRLKTRFLVMNALQTVCMQIAANY